jgi:molybdopterin synthase catalytic subunit
LNHVTVQLFARYAELLGRSEVLLDVPVDARVTDVVTALRALPGGTALPAEPFVAVNMRQVPQHTVLQSGDEIALLPPLAGG